MAKVRVYRTYNFVDKDPIIDISRTILQQVLGSDHFVTKAARLSGVSRSALSNWYEGSTRRPQFATVAAVLSSVGYDLSPKKDGPKIDEETELKKAMDWIAKKRYIAIVPDKPRARKAAKRKAA